jgi:hypothetical protein
MNGAISDSVSAGFGYLMVSDVAARMVIPPLRKSGLNVLFPVTAVRTLQDSIPVPAFPNNHRVPTPPTGNSGEALRTRAGQPNHRLPFQSPGTPTSTVFAYSLTASHHPDHPIPQRDRDTGNQTQHILEL